MQTITPIVARALSSPIADIGQLNPAELRQLNKAVKIGTLQKAKGGPYPAPKTVFASPGIDVAHQRREAIANLLRLRMQPYAVQLAALQA